MTSAASEMPQLQEEQAVMTGGGDIDATGLSQDRHTLGYRSTRVGNSSATSDRSHSRLDVPLLASRYAGFACVRPFEGLHEWHKKLPCHFP